MKTYNKDPEKGEKEISKFTFFEGAGLINYFEERGYSINPDHNLELLIPFRLEQYKDYKKDFIRERKLNALETTDLDIKLFYSNWLKKESKVIVKWLDSKPSSANVEKAKYQYFINSEIEKIKNEIKKIFDSTKKSNVFPFEITPNKHKPQLPDNDLKNKVTNYPNGFPNKYAEDIFFFLYDNFQYKHQITRISNIYHFLNEKCNGIDHKEAFVTRESDFIKFAKSHFEIEELNRLKKPNTNVYKTTHNPRLNSLFNKFLKEH